MPGQTYPGGASPKDGQYGTLEPPPALRPGCESAVHPSTADQSGGAWYFGDQIGELFQHSQRPHQVFAPQSKGSLTMIAGLYWEADLDATPTISPRFL